MLNFGTCPRCKMDVSKERSLVQPIICNHCGFSVNKKEEESLKIGEKHTTIIFSTFLTLMTFSFLMVMNWDIYSLEVIPLKIKQITGSSSPADAERMSEICMSLKKWDCVESEYSKAAASDATQFARLGHFQMKRAKTQQAAESFYAYFKNGGTDLEASYNYAKALAHLGKVDEAVEYFEQVLNSRPDIRQVTVTQNYVKLLMDHQRYVEAKTLIENIRKQGPEADQFMDVEFKKIQEFTTASHD